MFKKPEEFAGFKQQKEIRAKKMIMIEYANGVAKAMMKAGEGHDNSSMLNRSIRGRTGSRRTSSAL